MSVHALTLGTFEADAAAQDVAIITYGASWCGHCLTFAPVFSSISAHYPSVFFGTVDTESQPTLAREAGIRSVPTVVLLRHGVVMGRHSGVLTAGALADLAESALSAPTSRKIA